MKNTSTLAAVARFALSMLSIFLMFAGGMTISNADEVEKYIGDVYSYGDFPGFAFTGKKNRAPDPEYFQVLLTEDRYFLLAKEVGGRRVVVLDAAAIPDGQVFIGFPLENECESARFPEETIFVTGQWVNRKSATGGYSGGYANSITKAWRVDFDKKKLEGIPTHDIKCEDDRTDADVD